MSEVDAIVVMTETRRNSIETIKDIVIQVGISGNIPRELKVVTNKTATGNGYWFISIKGNIGNYLESLIYALENMEKGNKVLSVVGVKFF